MWKIFSAVTIVILLLFNFYSEYNMHQRLDRIEGVLTIKKEDSPVEIGVVLLPDDFVTLSANDLAKEATYLLQQAGLDMGHKINRPHITLYRLRVNEGDLDKIAKEVRRISSTFNPFKLRMADLLKATSHGIIWQVIDFNDEPLNLIQRATVEAVRTYRAGAPLQQVAEHQDRHKDVHKSLVEDYGIFWGVPGKTFKPHITLLYGIPVTAHKPGEPNNKISHVIQSLNPPHEATFHAQRMAIVRLGYHGNVEKILYEFTLGTVCQ